MNYVLLYDPANSDVNQNVLARVVQYPRKQSVTRAQWSANDFVDITHSLTRAAAAEP